MAKVAKPPANQDVVRTAKRRGGRLRRRLIANKELLSSTEFLAASDMTVQSLEKAVAAGRMFSLEAGGQPYYPAFFVDARLNRRRLGNVTRLLASESNWAKWLFFNTPKTSLAKRTPIEAMLQGDYARVRRAAAAMAER